MCACRGCYLLFLSEGAGGGHFRAVPDRYVAFPDFEFSAGAMGRPADPGRAWRSSSSTRRSGRVAAFYPGPAGATESELPLDAVGRGGGGQSARSARCSPTSRRSWCASGPDRSGAECYVVPIDLCYELVGRLRRIWRGFDGGQEAHDEIDGFFDRLRERAR